MSRDVTEEINTKTSIEGNHNPEEEVERCDKVKKSRLHVKVNGRIQKRMRLTMDLERCQ